MDGTQTVITVRGEAQRTVDPDGCALHARIQVRRTGRADALEALAAAQRSITGSLGALGGVPRTAATDRDPLAWTGGSVQTYQEHSQSSLARKGRIVASLSVTVHVRDFALLDRVALSITGAEDVTVDHVSWELDDDNPAATEVRGDAVRAAVQRGRDYAAALGATITGVNQIADVGLLDESGTLPGRAARPAGAFGMRSRGAEEEPPELVLDPEPQTVHAQIEARLIAAGVDLTTR